jgi:hypothetical protein
MPLRSWIAARNPTSSVRDGAAAQPIATTAVRSIAKLQGDQILNLQAAQNPATSQPDRTSLLNKVRADSLENLRMDAALRESRRLRTALEQISGSQLQRSNASAANAEALKRQATAALRANRPSV